ncbi:MAG: hypothetical protein R3272_13785 [Candidatus Promineifilaceae bacterium]|nr:hypothetical protein [Candidatus Promineifilaceae bacterium]
MTEREGPSAGLRYVAVAAIVLFLALLGYLGYELYPRFDLPAASGAGLLVLAAAAGVASFFSPCSFPLLATLLARQVKEEEPAEARAHLLQFAAALAVGATLFLLLAGGAIALGAGPLFEQVTFTSSAGRSIRLLVGAALILLGLLQWRGISPGSDAVFRVVKPLKVWQAQLRREQPTVAFGLFGFAYILAGFG